MRIKTCVCALIAALLSLLACTGGLFNQGDELLPSARGTLETNGIYAKLDVSPEIGILTGDVIFVSWKIFFNQEEIEVDVNQVAEQYLEFKENYFAGCEEYSPVKLIKKTRGNITKISLMSGFQCWLTQEKSTRVDASFQYYQVKNGVILSTSTYWLSKNIMFAAIPADNPRPLAEHTISRNGLDMWLIVLGGALLACGVALLIKIAASLKNSPKQPENEKSEKFSLSALREMPPRIAVDKLYHICIKLGAEEAKLKLREMYGGDEIDPSDLESCLRAVEDMIDNEGDAP